MRRAFGIVLLTLLASVTPAAVAQLCSAGTVPTMNLGTYTGGQSTTGAGAGTITCNSGTKYTIALDKGLGAGATTTIRKMTLNGVTLNYQLFQNSSDTLNWGNTTDVLTGTGTGGNQNYTIFPLIPGGQYVPPGTYTDTVTASVTDSGTFSEPFTVTATVVAACTISAAALNFGTYSGLLVNATSTLSITCTNTTSYNVGLSAGVAAGATVTNRSMTGPSSALLGYKLFSNSGLTTNWGNTVGTNTVAGTGNGALQPLSVYGQVPAAQYVRPGSYTDTITATITY
jgi:spore coat protein U-like protein